MQSNMVPLLISLLFVLGGKKLYCANSYWGWGGVGVVVKEEYVQPGK